MTVQPSLKVKWFRIELCIDEDRTVFYVIRKFLGSLYPPAVGQRFWSAFVELASNIWKFAYDKKPGGGIWVKFVEDGEKISMIVEDKGRPVTREDRERMIKALAPRRFDDPLDFTDGGTGLLFAKASADELALPVWDEGRGANVVCVTVYRKPVDFRPTSEELGEAMDRS